MKVKLIQIVSFLGCAAMLHGMTALAEDNDTEISLSAGVEFTSQELTAFVSRRITDDWRLQLYALTGFTDSSPDWGGGIQIKRALIR